MIDLFNPERIVIGSIFTRAERWFRQPMEQAIAAEALPRSRSVCRVYPSQLSECIGDMAAITVAWTGWKERQNT